MSSIERGAASAKEKSTRTSAHVLTTTLFPEYILPSAPFVNSGVPRLFRLARHSDGALAIQILIRYTQNRIGVLLISHSSLKAIGTQSKEVFARSSLSNCSLGTMKCQRRVCQDAKKSRTG